MMRATVAASVAASNQLTQQAHAAAGAAAQNAGVSQVATASAAAREAVTSFERDMYERKVFDPYLHFTSKEDEEAYRKREAEREKATHDALAKNTPEGNLKATQISIEQLKDAGAHGADKSPEYASTMNGLTSSRQQLESAISTQSPAQSARADRLEAAEPASDLDQAKAKIDPSVLAAFSSLVASTPAQTKGHGLTTAAIRDSGTALAHS